MKKCFGFDEKRLYCRVMEDQYSRPMIVKGQCGMDCPFYKPEGMEKSYIRMGDLFIRLTPAQLRRREEATKLMEMRMKRGRRRSV